MRTSNGLSICLAVAIAIAAHTSARPAVADTQTILGQRMKVEDPLPGVNPSKRRVVVVARERLSPNTIVGDPIAAGATVEVVVNGGTSTRQTFTLPPGPPPVSTGPGWVGFNGPGSGKYKYVDKNGEASPVTQLVLAYKGGGTFRLKAVVDARGNNAPVDVVPGNPTTELGVSVTLGGGDAYCVLFGGAAGGYLKEKPGTLVSAGRPMAEGCPEGFPAGGCGDGVVNSLDEECDAPDDAACPGQCGTAEVPDGFFACLCKTKPRQRVVEHADADLDLGWTGRGHDAGIVEGGGYLVDLSDCDGGGECTVGPSCSLPPHSACAVAADASSGTTGDSICAALGQGTCRKERTAVGPHCFLDVQKKCDPRLASDPVCGAPGDHCVRSLHGPPLPLSAAGVTMCVVNVFSEDVVGTTNLVSGAGAVRLRQRAVVHSGTGPLDAPCPVCGGFCAVSRDRCDDDADCGGEGPCVTDPVCSAGANTDQPCRSTPPFGGGSALFGSTSVDCPPFPAQDVSAGGIDLLLSPATTGNVSKVPSITCNAPGFANDVCVGGVDEGKPCPPAACTGGLCAPQCHCPNGPLPQKPNACADACLGGSNDRAPCSADSECPGGFCHRADCRVDPTDGASCQEGVCTAGPFDGRCSLSRYQSCTLDADCAPPVCPACETGETCDLQARQCLVNAGGALGVERCGAPGIPERTTAALFCVAGSTSPTVNSLFGLPGPGALTQPESTITVP